MFVKLLMLLFDGRVKADDGSLGKSSIQFNEDVGVETMADIMWSAIYKLSSVCGLWALLRPTIDGNRCHEGPSVGCGRKTGAVPLPNRCRLNT